MSTDASKAHALAADHIGFLSWNVSKAGRRWWDGDLRRLTEDKDLVLLQEARLTPSFTGMLADHGYHGTAPGWRTSGVITVATAAHIQENAFQHNEPLLRTPKAALVTEYRLSDRSDTLLVVNVHMINFEFGVERFSGQLNDLHDVMARHKGPIILSGDFNTWRPKRMNVIQSLVADLDMTDIEFDRDHRSRAFGRPLDHVFVRGLLLDQANVEAVYSSDHNPLTAVFRARRMH